MIRVFRILPRRHSGQAFSGEGARLYGGRWNPRGLAMVYTSSALSLAALECLVNFNIEDARHARFVSVAANIPDTIHVERVTAADLPADWRTYPAPVRLQEIGARWIREGRSAVLAVPSAVIPVELNYLLNPLHKDFAKIELEEAQEFVFDPRLAHKG